MKRLKTCGPLWVATRGRHPGRLRGTAHEDGDLREWHVETIFPYFSTIM